MRRAGLLGLLIAVLCAPAATARPDPERSRQAAARAAGAAEMRPGVAAAGTRWRPCTGPRGARCRRVAVPLDRATGTGRVRLRVMRLGSRRPTHRALLYLSGGPGGAGILEFRDALFTPAIRRLRVRYDLVGFDQRGTGSSGLLRCRALERNLRLRSTRAAARCAQRIGRRRAFYTTQATVADMEAIRRAAGARRLLLYGVSYGTKLALAYARAYPDRVERMILDSVVDPDESDEFGLESLHAMPATLRRLCPQRCAGVTRDPGADLAALTARLRRRPLRGVVRRLRRPPAVRTLTPTAIADLLFDADYNPPLRAGVPSAVRGALVHRDAAPLLRLIEAAKPLALLPPPSAFSSARYATVCEETPLPWRRGTPFDQRLPEARRRAAALGPAAFAPFDFEVARADEIDLCRRWPEAPQAPVLAAGPYPDVPVLLLQGAEDLRTPPSTSARVAAQIPRAVRVTVPGVGHAVLAADPSRCAERQLERWLRGRRVRRRCERVPTFVPPEPVLPVRLTGVRADRGHPRRIGRTIAGLRLMMQDLAFSISPALGLPVATPGLRGGRIVVEPTRLRLRRLVVVRGLRITGGARLEGPLRVRVGGSAAAHGSVSIEIGGRLRGTLGGRRVRARL